MNIKEFKEGDIITRNEPMTYKHNGAQDSSYCGDRLVLKGVDDKSKIIFFEANRGNLKNLSYARDLWNEGWCEYPEHLFQKVRIETKAKK